MPEADFRSAGLTEAEYRSLVGALGRDPNPTEVAMVGVLWSEHCSYKHSRRTLSLFPTEGPRVAVGPGENAGVLDVGNGWLVAAKIESHNHPSAVEPVEGAATGLGGILRDVLSTGARPIAFMDALFFGPPGERETDYLTTGVVGGVAKYGNCVGVPTVGGEVTFDLSYRGAPLVNAFCVGLVKKEKLLRSNAEGVGNALILLGSPTGRDGVAGASFASRETSLSEEDRPQVQIGDPFVGKLLVEAVLDLNDRGLIQALGDLGAAGITSAGAEMAHRGEVGIDVDLEAFPLREEGMSDAEILLSETQERMLLVVSPKDVAAVMEVAQHWGIPAARIGAVTETGRMRALRQGQPAADLPVELLADGAPRITLQKLDEKAPPRPVLQGKSLSEALHSHLKDPAFRSRLPIYERYDDRVGLRTVGGPGGDAALIRIPEAGVHLVVSTDSRPRLVAQDPFRGGAETVLEGARNLAAVGAEAIGITDCLNFGDPDLPQVADAFVRSVEGMAEAARALSIPVIGGNVSLYNGTPSRPILPTPVVGTLGLLDEGIRPDDLLRPPTLGQKVFLVGPFEDLGVPGGPIPHLDFPLEGKTMAAVRDLRKSRAASILRDVSEGGLFQTLTELSLATGRGGTFPTPAGVVPLAFWLGEGGPRYLILAQASEPIETWASAWGLQLLFMGELTGDDLTVESSVEKVRIPREALANLRERPLWGEEAAVHESTRS